MRRKFFVVDKAQLHGLAREVLKSIAKLHCIENRWKAIRPTQRQPVNAKSNFCIPILQWAFGIIRSDKFDVTQLLHLFELVAGGCQIVNTIFVRNRKSNYNVDDGLGWSCSR